MTMTETQPTAPPLPTKGAEQAPRRGEPIDLFDELQEEMTRLWAHTLPLLPRSPLWTRGRLALTPSRWAPTMDVYEKDGQLVVKAELPGLKKEDIAVSLEGRALVIRGERQADSEVKEEDYRRVERTFGSFYRRLPLGVAVEADMITASYKDGLLEIHIPKPVLDKPKAHKIALT